jgi:hypothetical protein
MKCANELKDCGPAADGFNPLRVCLKCLDRMAVIAGPDFPVGTGSPARRERPRLCPRGCTGATGCQEAKRKAGPNGWTLVTPPLPGVCAMSR